MNLCDKSRPKSPNMRERKEVRILKVLGLQMYFGVNIRCLAKYDRKC